MSSFEGPSKAVLSLIEGLQSDDSPSIIKSLKTVIMLGKHEKPRDNLGSAGICELVIKKMNDDKTPQVQELGCLSLANLAFSDANKIRILARRESDRVFTHILEDKDAAQKVMFGCVWVLHTMSTSHLAAVSLCKSNIDVLLAKMLFRSKLSNEIIDKICDVLINLSASSPRDVSHQTIPLLVKLIRKGGLGDSVRDNLLTTISNSSTDMKADLDTISLLLDILPGFAKFRSSGFRLPRSSPSVITLSALANLSVQRENHAVMNDAKVSKVLSSMLPDEHRKSIGTTLSCITLILANCSTHLPFAQAMAKNNAIPGLIAIASSRPDSLSSSSSKNFGEIMEARTMALFSLYSLSGTDDEKVNRLFVPQIERIAEFLKDERDNLHFRSYISALIFNLSETKEIASKMANLGCISPLVEFLKQEPVLGKEEEIESNIYNSVCAIRNLVDPEPIRKRGLSRECSNTAKDEFFCTGALELLIGLIQERKSMQNHASNLICVYAEIEGHCARIGRDVSSLSVLALAALRIELPETKGIDRQCERECAVYCGETLKRIAASSPEGGELKEKVMKVMKDVETEYGIEGTLIDEEEEQSLQEAKRQERERILGRERANAVDRVSISPSSSLDNSAILSMPPKEIEQLVTKCVQCMIGLDEAENEASILKTIAGLSPNHEKLVKFVVSREQMAIRDEAEQLGDRLFTQIAELKEAEEDEVEVEVKAPQRRIFYAIDTYEADALNAPRYSYSFNDEFILLDDSHPNGWWLVTRMGEEGVRQGWVLGKDLRKEKLDELEIRQIKQKRIASEEAKLNEKKEAERRSKLRMETGADREMYSFQAAKPIEDEDEDEDDFLPPPPPSVAGDDEDSFIPPPPPAEQLPILPTGSIVQRDRDEKSSRSLQLTPSTIGRMVPDEPLPPPPLPLLLMRMRKKSF